MLFAASPITMMLSITARWVFPSSLKFSLPA